MFRFFCQLLVTFWGLEADVGGFDPLAHRVMDLGYVGAAWGCQMCDLMVVDDFTHATSRTILPQNQAAGRVISLFFHENGSPGVSFAPIPQVLPLNQFCRRFRVLWFFVSETLEQKPG